MAHLDALFEGLFKDETLPMEQPSKPHTTRRRVNYDTCAMPKFISRVFCSHDEAKKMLTREYETGLSVKKLADKYGVAHMTIVIAFRKLKIRTRPPGGANFKPKKRYMYKGRSVSSVELAKIAGLPNKTVQSRLSCGMDPERAVELPKQAVQLNRYNYRGEWLTRREIAHRLGATKNSIDLRFQRGWTLDEIMTTPPNSRRK